MGNIQRYTAYHATDKHNVESIISNNFTFNKSDEHWLGNGIYFFIDVALAREWGKKAPTKKFGTIENYAIIEAIIEVDDDYVCDLTMLDDYKFVAQKFSEFCAILSSRSVVLENASYLNLRCAFFNELVRKYNFKCLISNFEDRKNFIDKNLWKTFRKIKTVYIETQICVTDNSCIVSKKQYTEILKGLKYEEKRNNCI